MAYWFLCPLVLLCLVSGVESSCHFPDFLQSPVDHGRLRPWTTRTWWLNLRHEPKWVEKQDIFVEGSRMWRHRENNHKSCDRMTRRVHYKTSFGQCSERKLVYNQTCLMKEKNDKFRVIQYNPNGSHMFSCLMFIQRNSSVVQVWEGPLRETNDPDLCDDNGFRLEEWPWIASWVNKPYFCPISGGFSFRTINRLTNEDKCEAEWRRSRLEVECINGDGLDFISPPGSRCNPFLKTGDWKRLRCWSGWELGDFIFMVAADPEEGPQYCLRFPKHHHGEFSVLVYFSVICPTETDGKPPHGIEYYELRMRRNNYEHCEDDEAFHCEAVREGDSCDSQDFAPYCRKSCQLCGGQVTSKHKCTFSPLLRGQWVLHEQDRTESVVIDRHHVTFSHFGRFTCKDESEKSQFKVISSFHNGCAPRYTCMEFKRPNNNVLQYRISRSLREDTEWEDLCNFQDDPFPLGNSYRSLHFKILILAEDLWPSYCGLDRSIPFNGTYGEETCSGAISDWDPQSCTTLGTITLRSNNCGALLLPVEYQCLGYIKDDDYRHNELLLTRSMDGKNDYNCWVITTFVPSGAWPWRVMYRLPTTQCTPEVKVSMEGLDRPTAVIYLEDDTATKRCIPEELSPKTVAPVVLSRSTQRTYVVEPALSDPDTSAPDVILVDRPLPRPNADSQLSSASSRPRPLWACPVALTLMLEAWFSSESGLLQQVTSLGKSRVSTWAWLVFGAWLLCSLRPEANELSVTPVSAPR